MKTLVIYYSLGGNTERIAKMISEQYKTDIEKIEMLKPYTGSYTEIVDQGQREVNNGYLPNIKSLDKNISDYVNIVIGTPTWWYTMAPAVRSFLQDEEWKDKNVVMFATNGGWPGHAIDDMKQICHKALKIRTKEIRFDSTGGNELVTSEKELNEWIESLNL